MKLEWTGMIEVRITVDTRTDIQELLKRLQAAAEEEAGRVITFKSSYWQSADTGKDVGKVTGGD